MGQVSDKLADFVLNSKNAKKISSSLAKTILNHWQREQLGTPNGIKVLIEASLIAEPEKTAAYLIEELGIPEDTVKTSIS